MLEAERPHAVCGGRSRGVVIEFLAQRQLFGRAFGFVVVDEVILRQCGRAFTRDALFHELGAVFLERCDDELDVVREVLI